MRDVSLRLERDETLALVGESGFGKSVTALSVMGLVQTPVGRIAAGRILLDWKDLASSDETGLERLRGNRMAMIFQEPMTSLSPVMTIGDQVAESLRVHRGLSRNAALNCAGALFEAVKIPSAIQRLREYPHQLSGGMRQRVMIAMALACEPAVLLADEPTTALDVTIQAQVLGLLRELRERRGLAFLLVSHDLAVVRWFCDRVAVMYLGRIVEEGPAASVLQAPLHPYARMLRDASPIPDPSRRGALPHITGEIPSANNPPSGCPFHPRCTHAISACVTNLPPLRGFGPGRRVACLRTEELRATTP